MDLVVNHSSDRHAWFQAALKDPFGKYGKYYVFREGKDGKEPNNWRSIFGGSAWEKVPGYDNLYYLHIFTKEQPDLNWENPKLREEIYEMILKWMDLGLGGFRLDAISHLKKNYQYTNLPPDGPDEYNMAFEYFNNVDGLADILCEMKERTFAPTDALTIGEYDHMGPEDVEDVIGENGSFSSVFDFCHTLDNVRNPKWGNTVALFDDYRDQLFAAQKIVDGRGMLCNFRIIYVTVVHANNQIKIIKVLCPHRTGAMNQLITTTGSVCTHPAIRQLALMIRQDSGGINHKFFFQSGFFDQVKHYSFRRRATADISCVESVLPPLDILRETQEIERELGRMKKSAGGNYSDRLIDIDILLYGDLILHTPELEIPHPLMTERRFVMG